MSRVPLASGNRLLLHKRGVGALHTTTRFGEHCVEVAHIPVCLGGGGGCGLIQYTVGSDGIVGGGVSRSQYGPLGREMGAI